MNFIKTYENHFSKKWCQESINYFENNTTLHHKGFMGASKRIQNSEITLDMREEQWKPLIEGLEKGITKYKSNYTLLNTNMSTWGLFVNCQLMKYLPGESYNYEHCEHGETSDGFGVKRIIAWQINLNTIEELGGTYFSYYKHTIEPKEGSLTFWPAGWTHMHKGLVSPKKNKYIITGWYSFY